MKNILRILLLCALAAILAGTFYFLYKKSEKPIPKTETTRASIRDIVRKTVATGAINPRREVAMKSQVSGIVDKLFIKAGDKVSAGQIIARVKIIPNMLNLNAAENRLNQAKIDLDNARLDFERNRQLLRAKVIAKTEFQSTELRFRNAEEEYSAAADNLQIIREGISGKQGGQTNTLIKSTISGMVLDVPVKEGNSVIESNTFNEGTTIASVADMGEMIFVGKVDESEVGKLKTGMPLLLSIGALQDEKFDAVLEYIAPKGVTENGAIQFEIKAAVSLRKDKFLRAGYSANADIILERKDRVLSVPEAVLMFEQDKPFVEVESSAGKFVKRAIKTGISDGLHTEVLEGIQGNEKIKVPERTEEEEPGAEE